MNRLQPRSRQTFRESLAWQAAWSPHCSGSLTFATMHAEKDVCFGCGLEVDLTDQGRIRWHSMIPPAGEQTPS